MKKSAKNNNLDFDSLLDSLDEEISELDYLSGVYDETDSALGAIDDEERRVMELLEQETPESLQKAQALMEVLLKESSKESE